jgi:hypothetical protein
LEGIGMSASLRSEEGEPLPPRPQSLRSVALITFAALVLLFVVSAHMKRGTPLGLN